MHFHAVQDIVIWHLQDTIHANGKREHTRRPVWVYWGILLILLKINDIQDMEEIVQQNC